MTPEGKFEKNPDGSCPLLARYQKLLAMLYNNPAPSSPEKCSFLGLSCFDCKFFKQVFQPEIMDSLPVQTPLCFN
jgi:hypothetical protein